MVIHNLYIGRYSSPNISKKDLKKLNDLGIRGYLFARKDCYSLKIFSSIDKDKTDMLAHNLRAKGFETDIETIEYKKK